MSNDQLDPQVCERARLARDARFDGRFFTAVLTTGIYCRPVCPAASRARMEHVRYYPSAAAAAEAGYRPCLRCRPEAAPGWSWRQDDAAVSRALTLIEEGFLAEAGIPELAAAVGLGERQLRRSFQRCLGAPPKAVADHHRLLFARQLLDQTPMSLTDVALAAGFTSLRRFNAAFKEAFGTPPGTLRRRPGAAASSAALRLGYRPPLDWPTQLAFFRGRAIPGVEQVSDRRYCRSIELDGQAGWLEVEPVDGEPALVLRIAFPDASRYRTIVSRVRRLFDLDVNHDAVRADLSRDPFLARLLAAAPGLRLPGAWDPFELTVRAVLGQQISVKAATTLAGRLASRFGEHLNGAPAGVDYLFPTAERLAGADLGGIGLTGKRALTLNRLAQAVAEDPGLLRIDSTPEAFSERLQQLPGIGPWTASYIAMRALSEPDAFPAADLGLLKATGLERAADVRARAEAWRPWRAYAAIHLWHSLAGRTANEPDARAPEGERKPCITT